MKNEKTDLRQRSKDATQ